MENMQYNKDALVVQANELARSQQSELSLLEAKLIRLTISQIVMQDEDLQTYICTANDLADFLGISKENVYRDLDTLSDTALKKIIRIRDKAKPTKRNGEPNYTKFQWFSQFTYNNGIVTIKIHENLKPYLIGLDRLFTEYGLDCILGLPTPNSIRLFELLTSYEDCANPYTKYTYTNPFPEIPKEKYELIFTIDYLKQYFNFGDKYPNNAHFIKYVIDSSVNGINTKSPNRVSYRTAKQGRKIAYVLFKINAWDDKDFMDFVRPTLDKDLATLL